LVSVIVLAVLTIAVVGHPGPLPGDLAVVDLLQQLGQPVPALAAFVRLTTSTEACLLAAIVPAVWLVRRDRRRGALAIAIGLLAMLAVQPLSKVAVDRPRPTAEQVDVRAEHESNSFPSGHSLSTATTWGAAALISWRLGRRGAGAALALPVAVTGLSSSIQGVHWPSDAIAGTIIGGWAAVAIAVTTIGSSGQPPTSSTLEA
jgi:undecaprenyl-diphosphatase